MASLRKLCHIESVSQVSVRFRVADQISDRISVADLISDRISAEDQISVKFSVANQISDRSSVADLISVRISIANDLAMASLLSVPAIDAQASGLGACLANLVLPCLSDVDEDTIDSGEGTVLL